MVENSALVGNDALVASDALERNDALERGMMPCRRIPSPHDVLLGMLVAICNLQSVAARIIGSLDNAEPPTRSVACTATSTTKFVVLVAVCR